MSNELSNAKDPNTAMLIEIILGYLGWMGMGHIYAGRTGEGVMRLFGWWVTLGVAVGLMLTVTGAGIITSASSGSEEGLLGAGIFSVCFMLLLVLGVLVAPVISGTQLKKKMRG